MDSANVSYQRINRTGSLCVTDRKLSASLSEVQILQGKYSLLTLYMFAGILNADRGCE